MKDYREKEMKNLMFVLFFLLLILCTPVLDYIKAAEDQSKYSVLSTILESAIISSVLSNAVLLLDCLIGSRGKDNLVGLFFITRSGETVFTKIKTGKLKDDRFALSDATKLYQEIIEQLPKDRREKHKFENKHWYSIYLNHQEMGQVSQSQRDYLMCRDLYIETLAFLLLYFLAILVFPNVITLSWRFVLVLVVLICAFNWCTHLKMKRFVYTVIAVDVSARKTECVSGF